MVLSRYSARGTLIVAALALSSLVYGKDKSNTYQMGTYIASTAVGDGTTTNNLSCGSQSVGSTTCSDRVRANQVTFYQIRVADGVWSVETDRQVSDSISRLLGSKAIHSNPEKANPLDLLKNGDNVLFRVEAHKNGLENDIFIPFADAPNKEAKFVGTFLPVVTPTKPKP